MSAIIKGTIFSDLNHNGILDFGEPGISNAYVVLQNPDGICTTHVTDETGLYTFDNLDIAGDYTIYETAVNPGATCPPINLGQPSGFADSTTFRTNVVNITKSDITNNLTIESVNYGHDNPPIFFSAPLSYEVTSSEKATSELLQINLVTGKVTTISANMGISVNAIGYNTLNYMIYGIESKTTNLIRISGYGIVTKLGSISNLPKPFKSYNVGDIDNSCHMFLYEQGASTFYVVDVNENSPTFGQLLDPTNGYILDTPPYGTNIINPPTNTLNITDWQYSELSNQLYGIIHSPSLATVISLNPTTGVVTSLKTTGLSSGDNYGAVFIDDSDSLYAINTFMGIIYRVKISGINAVGEVFSETIPSLGNSGAICHYTFIDIAFGNAPDTTMQNGPDDYSTRLINNGPRHELINNLRFGTQLTSESNDYENQATTANDTSRGIEDCGVTLPLTPLLTTDTTYSLNVSFTNPTGLLANLYGWIDFNQNGIFEENEAAPVQIVPSSKEQQQVTLNFTVPAETTLKPDHTFVRLRITTDNLINKNPSPTKEDTRSLGGASDGEVKDHILILKSPEEFLDFGDAPDIEPGQGTGNYRTLLASDGPRHIINPNLTLGFNITAESDAHQNANATGDDLVLDIPDDGTTLPLPNMSIYSLSYTILLTVINNTTSPANIYGWIDFNKDGIFQTNEGTATIVPPLAAPQLIVLNFTVPYTLPLAPGQTFVRVRLTTENLINTGTLTEEDTRSYGLARDGEVEDYELILEEPKEPSDFQDDLDSQTLEEETLNPTPIEDENKETTYEDTRNDELNEDEEVQEPESILEEPKEPSDFQDDLNSQTLEEETTNTTPIESEIKETTYEDTRNDELNEDEEVQEPELILEEPSDLQDTLDLQPLEEQTPNPIPIESEIKETTYEDTRNDELNEDEEVQEPELILEEPSDLQDTLDLQPLEEETINPTPIENETKETTYEDTRNDELNEDEEVQEPESILEEPKEPSDFQYDLDSQPLEEETTNPTPIEDEIKETTYEDTRNHELNEDEEVQEPESILEESKEPSDFQYDLDSQPLEEETLNPTPIESEVKETTYEDTRNNELNENEEVQEPELILEEPSDLQDTLDLQPLEEQTPNPIPIESEIKETTYEDTRNDELNEDEEVQEPELILEEPSDLQDTLDLQPLEEETINTTPIEDENKETTYEDTRNDELNEDEEAQEPESILEEPKEPSDFQYDLDSQPLEEETTNPTPIEDEIKETTYEDTRNNELNEDEEVQEPESILEEPKETSDFQDDLDSQTLEKETPNPTPIEDKTTLPIPSMLTTSSSYTLPITVFNNTKESANIYAWIDFNHDGIFQTNEGTTATVIPSIGEPSLITQTIPLIFNVPYTLPLIPGETSVRVRVTTKRLINTNALTDEDTRSYESVQDGEVEDYKLILEEPTAPSSFLDAPLSIPTEEQHSAPAYEELTQYEETKEHELILEEPTTPSSFLDASPSMPTEEQTSAQTYEELTQYEEAKEHELILEEPTTPSSFLDAPPSMPTEEQHSAQTYEELTQYEEAKEDELILEEPTAPSSFLDAPLSIPTEEQHSAQTYEELTQHEEAKEDELILEEPTTPSNFLDAPPSMPTEEQHSAPAYEELTQYEEPKEHELILEEPTTPSNFLNVPPSTPTEEQNSTLDFKSNTDAPSSPSIDLCIINFSNTTFAAVGDIIRYTLAIKNTETIDLNTVIIKDPLTPDLQYVGNLTVNGAPINGNIILGGNIGTLKPKETSIISFDAKVIAEPIGGEIINKSNATFNYTIGKDNFTRTSSSNENIISVFNIDVTLNKTANKKYAAVDDTITYTALIENSGDLNALNVVFKDNLPNEVELIEDSFTVNSKVINNVDLLNGVFIGAIDASETVTIKYKAKVVCGSCKTITHSSQAKFECLFPNNQTNTYYTEVNENSSTSIYIKTYVTKGLNVYDTVSLPSDKPIIQNIDSIDSKIEDLQYSVIKDSCSQDEFKILVEGVLKETIYYNSCNFYNFNEENNFDDCNTFKHYTPFKTSISIPKCCDMNNLDLNGVILCNKYKLINPHYIKIRISLLLSVKEES